jgi:hypothetical protein
MECILIIKYECTSLVVDFIDISYTLAEKVLEKNKNKIESPKKNVLQV